MNGAGPQQDAALKPNPNTEATKVADKTDDEADVDSTNNSEDESGSESGNESDTESSGSSSSDEEDHDEKKLEDSTSGGDIDASVEIKQQERDKNGIVKPKSTIHTEDEQPKENKEGNLRLKADTMSPPQPVEVGLDRKGYESADDQQESSDSENSDSSSDDSDNDNKNNISGLNLENITPTYDIIRIQTSPDRSRVLTDVKEDRGDILHAKYEQTHDIANGIDTHETSNNAGIILPNRQVGAITAGKGDVDTNEQAESSDSDSVNSDSSSENDDNVYENKNPAAKLKTGPQTNDTAMNLEFEDRTEDTELEQNHKNSDEIVQVQGNTSLEKRSDKSDSSSEDGQSRYKTENKPALDRDIHYPINNEMRNSPIDKSANNPSEPLLEDSAVSNIATITEDRNIEIVNGATDPVDQDHGDSSDSYSETSDSSSEDDNKAKCAYDPSEPPLEHRAVSNIVSRSENKNEEIISGATGPVDQEHTDSSSSDSETSATSSDGKSETDTESEAEQKEQFEDELLSKKGNSAISTNQSKILADPQVIQNIAGGNLDIYPNPAVSDVNTDTSENKLSSKKTLSRENLENEQNPHSSRTAILQEQTKNLQSSSDKKVDVSNSTDTQDRQEALKKEKSVAETENIEASQIDDASVNIDMQKNNHTEYSINDQFDTQEQLSLVHSANSHSSEDALSLDQEESLNRGTEQISLDKRDHNSKYQDTNGKIGNQEVVLKDEQQHEHIPVQKNDYYLGAKDVVPDENYDYPINNENVNYETNNYETRIQEFAHYQKSQQYEENQGCTKPADNDKHKRHQMDLINQTYYNHHSFVGENITYAQPSNTNISAEVFTTNGVENEFNDATNYSLSVNSNSAHENDEKDSSGSESGSESGTSSNIESSSGSDSDSSSGSNTSSDDDRSSEESNDSSNQGEDVVQSSKSVYLLQHPAELRTTEDQKFSAKDGRSDRSKRRLHHVVKIPNIDTRHESPGAAGSPLPRKTDFILIDQPKASKNIDNTVAHSRTIRKQYKNRGKAHAMMLKKPVPPYAQTPLSNRHIAFKSRAYLDPSKKKIRVDIKGPPLPPIERTKYKTTSISSANDSNQQSIKIEMHIRFQRPRKKKKPPIWWAPPSLPPLKRSHPLDPKPAWTKSDPNMVTIRAQYPALKFGNKNTKSTSNYSN